ncbi:hypothetical protein IAR55_002377 [Kwoniella newhampshirensis]|uniref:DUF7918 domain-containing protein n=1 Tax=Kwoniella newhampshirensis TaxID=1651941 RepID=A0AAW0Z0X1_9TREE
MRAKEFNGFEAYLTVDGEKLHEHNLVKLGGEGRVRRLECYIEPKPHTEFAINVRLGRRKPWTGDLIAEPTIDGRPTHSLHVRKNWHRTHFMDTLFEEDAMGQLSECKMTFGSLEDLRRYGSNGEGDYEVGNDEREGVISIAVSRGEVEKIKPVKMKISQSLRRDNGKGGVVGKGRSVESDERAAFGEEFRYDEKDAHDPWVKFVFKIRSREYLDKNKLYDRIPAQQHPLQVANHIKLKAEPEPDSYDDPIDHGDRTDVQRSQTFRSLKRERIDDDNEYLAAKSREIVQEELAELREEVRRLRSRATSVMTVDTSYGMRR